MLWNKVGKQLTLHSLIGAASIFLFCAPSQSAWAQNTSQWRYYKQSDKISVAYHQTEQGVYAINASITLANTKHQQFINLLTTTSDAPKWLTNVRSVTQLAQESAHITQVYTYIDSPWPVKNRELYTRSCYERINEKTTRLNVIAFNPDRPVADSSVRMTHFYAQWLMQQQGENLKLTYQVYADPQGSIPHWITNKVTLKNVHKTLKNLERQLRSAGYDQAPSLQEGQCQQFSAQMPFGNLT